MFAIFQQIALGKTCNYWKNLILIFLISVGPKLKDNEKLVQITFDEMHTKKKCGWDLKTDTLIGPGTKMQTAVVRSLTGLFKFPWLFDFDRKMTKKLLLQLIYVMESMGFKNLLSCCDQAQWSELLYIVQIFIFVTQHYSNFHHFTCCYFIMHTIFSSITKFKP